MKKILLLLLIALLLLVSCSSSPKEAEEEKIYDVKFSITGCEYTYAEFNGDYYIKVCDESVVEKVMDAHFYTDQYKVYSDDACTVESECIFKFKYFPEEHDYVLGSTPYPTESDIALIIDGYDNQITITLERGSQFEIDFPNNQLVMNPGFDQGVIGTCSDATCEVEVVRNVSFDLTFVPYDD